MIDRSLVAFTDLLAARTATPGGGSMAAFLAASGAALVSMACRFTSGEKHAAVEPAMLAAVAKLDALRPRAMALVDADAASYDAVSAAFALPRADDAQKAARTAAIQAGLRGALEVPFETLGLAVEGLEQAAPRAAEVNKNLISDLGVGARCLASAAEGAYLNVRINAASIQDAAYVAQRLGVAESRLARARDLSTAIAERVSSRI